jgi:hypothetical protein
MKDKAILATLVACTLVAFTGPPVAGELWTSKAYADGASKAHAKWKRAVRVRGFLPRGGYYSYIDQDAINTYSGTRSVYSSTSPFRFPLSEQQSPGGPFDHGFFFDSDLGPRWNNAPYPR